MEDVELQDDTKLALRQEQTRLVNILDSLDKLEGSKEWSTLKELVFDKSLDAIERQMLNESLAPIIDLQKLYKLQGEWAWCKQYSDLKRFGETLKKQLQNIKLKLT